ncbi:hypothetical protein [Nocardioides sp. BYT-33-1]|uniref:hypothetical protein n=1 Tax=Nocardioides sp. BYT-33-1 TaxID=3416952 RepID=UPI003F531A85
MTNPYGGGYPSYQPGPNPYDGSSPTAGPPAYDGLSIAALVCSLSCCAAPVGIGLGIAGIVRTGGGRRSGRWAAVTGLVVGAVVLLAGIGFLVLAGIMGSRTVWEDEATAGQCIDIDFLDDPIEASCGDPHAGEVIWAGRFDDDLVALYDDFSGFEFCGELPGLEPVYLDAIRSGDYVPRIEIDTFDEGEPERGDAFFCYVERGDGEKITGRLRDLAGTTGA